MRLPAELCKMQRKKRETDGFSKSTLMPPPGLHPTSGFGARHGLPKFLGIKNASSYKTMRQIGEPRGIRTLDLSDANRTLSQLSYRPIETIRALSLSEATARTVAFGPAELDKSELFPSTPSAVKVSSNRTVWVPSL